MHYFDDIPPVKPRNITFYKQFQIRIGYTVRILYFKRELWEWYRRLKFLLFELKTQLIY